MSVYPSLKVMIVTISILGNENKDVDKAKYRISEIIW